MAAEISEQILLSRPVLGEDDYLLIHILDQLNRLLRLRIRFHGPDLLKQHDHPLTARGVLRQLFDQIDQGDKDGVPAAAHLALQSDKRQHAA
ncbi:hypothetical protein D3C71_1914570 [compost metagenome]